MQVIRSESVSASCDLINAVYHVCVTEWAHSINSVCRVHILYRLLCVATVYSVYVIR